MDLLLYFLVTLVIAWSVYGLYARAKSNSLVGSSAAELTRLFPELEGDNLPHLIYCYSQSCGPCRAMKPYIDTLAEETDQVSKIDLSEHPSLARQLGIRAVPTTLVVQGGMINQIVVGKRSEKELRTLLNSHQ